MAADRTDFLLRMYDQMFNDINTHILVVWQAVAVVVGAFALLGLVEKSIISIDLATSLIVLLCAWMLAHLYDSSYWYNRNLVIIANIERQFLVHDDLHNVQYYFGKHRSKAAMLTHLKIQYGLGVAIATLFVSFHFLTRILPVMREIEPFHWQRLLPYAALLICGSFLVALRRNRIAAYQEFLANSPGKEVDTADVVYGVGHPTDTQPIAAAKQENREEANRDSGAGVHAP